MSHYFSPSKRNKFSGKQRATLPVVLNYDLKVADQLKDIKQNFGVYKLEDLEDLAKLQTLSEDRKKWTNLSIFIYEAAQADRFNLDLEADVL